MTAKLLCPCGNPASHLCDKPVPLSREEMLSRLKSGERINGERATCDAPLCDKCRVTLGNLIVCARGRGGCDVDSVDRCSKHATMEALGL